MQIRARSLSKQPTPLPLPKNISLDALCFSYELPMTYIQEYNLNIKLDVSNLSGFSRTVHDVDVEHECLKLSITEIIDK